MIQRALRRGKTNQRDLKFLPPVMTDQPISPHPDPLPQGEGTPYAGGRTFQSDSRRRVQWNVLPLPKGEGWGEGKSTLLTLKVRDIFTRFSKSESNVRQ